MTVLNRLRDVAVVRKDNRSDWVLFGAMIAATDPVAVLATFRQLGVGERATVERRVQQVRCEVSRARRRLLWLNPLHPTYLWLEGRIFRDPRCRAGQRHRALGRVRGPLRGRSRVAAPGPARGRSRYPPRGGRSPRDRPAPVR